MPIIKSAKKKLRQDKKRSRDNLRIQATYKSAVKSALVKPTKKSISDAQSAVDKAAKKKVIHANKAARLKRQIARHA
jgi:small subunit ribosomal protein S20